MSITFIETKLLELNSFVAFIPSVKNHHFVKFVLLTKEYTYRFYWGSVDVKYCMSISEQVTDACTRITVQL